MFMLLQDGNGFINRMELRHVMMNLGEKMSEEECDALVDVRPHLSNFKSNFAEENRNTIVRLLGLVKRDHMLQKLKKINIEMTALLTECGQTVFGFTRVLCIIFNLIPSIKEAIFTHLLTINSAIPGGRYRRRWLHQL